jgi:hypothetical protein
MIVGKFLETESGSKYKWTIGDRKAFRSYLAAHMDHTEAESHFYSENPTGSFPNRSNWWQFSKCENMPAFGFRSVDQLHFMQHLQQPGNIDTMSNYFHIAQMWSQQPDGDPRCAQEVAQHMLDTNMVCGGIGWPPYSKLLNESLDFTMFVKLRKDKKGESPANAYSNGGEHPIASFEYALQCHVAIQAPSRLS